MFELIVGLILGIPFLFGILILYLMWNLKNQPGIDNSNWFNSLRILWFLYTKPHYFSNLYYKREDLIYVKAMPWLSKDEGDIVNVK